jgi:cell wall-associated NlpC family hydrolase
MAFLGKSPNRGGGGDRRTPRWAVATLAGALALLAVAPSAMAAAAGGGETQTGTPFGTLGQTVLTALVKTTNADEAIGALGNSLALTEARNRIAAEVEAAASAPPKSTPAVPSDPATMPPASAGSNGSISPSAKASGAKIFAHSRGDSLGGSNAILLTGIALAPPDAPEVVKGVINNANTIVGRPYVWGGGHGSFYSAGYDCSGAVSFALFGGGLIPEPLASTPLESWGAPGPGRWITVYANAGHAFAEIAGLRWDTVGDAQGTGPRWHLAPTSTAGFVARHPPGL